MINKWILLTALLLATGCTSQWRGPFQFHGMKTVKLKPINQIQNLAIDESSGIVKSRQYKNIYWTHNDSGGKAEIYPIYIQNNKTKLAPIKISGSQNVDWEDIAVDKNNNLIISDIGNNFSNREHLSFYILPEPNPFKKNLTQAVKTYHFQYPDYTPQQQTNFNSEALFSYNEKVYILTKHDNDGFTKLYRFNELRENELMSPEKIDRFAINGKVTAADMSPDESKLVILTYNGIWLFTEFKDDQFFKGKAYFMPIKAKQCEAICFKGEEELIITNEQRDIFKVSLKDFLELKRLQKK
jgi:hypothetical protein